MISYPLPFRQIHLDFHTGPNVPDVGSQFNAREFAATMKRAHVNSVTVFAKCHHGHLYYDTQRAERHPGLSPDLNLLREQVDALHAEGIRAPIYISVLCDEYAANSHPEWVARREDNSHVKWGGGQTFLPGWQIMDMSTPYQEFLAEQTREILSAFAPVDGIFFDMCWDQPSTTQSFLAGMVKSGLDPESETDRGLHARAVAHAYMKRFYDQVKASSPDATVYFNARPMFLLPEEIDFLEQVEIEALPTGGWGYMYFPRNVRYARTFGKPTMGMTARFHKSWADFGGLKPQAALDYETAQMLAHGARCSVGDQLHPRGTLDKGAYELIGAAYRRVAAREAWVEGARPLAQIGLFQVPTGVLSTTQSSSQIDDGATRMLTQLKHQFDVVGPETDFAKYELLILPDAIAVDDALAARLRAYLQAGGKLLASGTSGLNAELTRSAIPEMGIEPEGMSPFTSTYIRFGDPISEGVPDSDHIMYERGVRVRPASGAQTLAAVVEPYFERAWNHFCSHAQTPGDQVSEFAAALQNGNTAYIAFPVFGAYARHGNIPYRMLVDKLLGRLLPRPMLRVEGPSGLEATVARQDDLGRTMVHLLFYPAERRTPEFDIAEDVIPLFDIRVELQSAKRPSRLRLVPEGTELEFEFSEGSVRFVVPQVRGHAMIEVVDG